MSTDATTPVEAASMVLQFVLELCALVALGFGAVVVGNEALLYVRGLR